MSDAFGRRLRAYRKLKQMTQADLAREIGVGIAIIGGIERGTRSPTQALLQQLTAILEVDEESLWGESSGEMSHISGHGE